jgi:hypothetical protein
LETIKTAEKYNCEEAEIALKQELQRRKDLLASRLCAVMGKPKTRDPKTTQIPPEIAYYIGSFCGPQV